MFLKDVVWTSLPSGVLKSYFFIQKFLESHVYRVRKDQYFACLISTYILSVIVNIPFLYQFYCSIFFYQNAFGDSCLPVGPSGSWMTQYRFDSPSEHVSINFQRGLRIIPYAWHVRNDAARLWLRPSRVLFRSVVSCLWFSQFVIDLRVVFH